MELEDGVVAVLRFPIPVTSLMELSAVLEKIYGPGLMIDPGTVMVVRLPTASD